MSIYDHITPSEQAAALGLLVNRVRRNTNAAEIPVLVVEGATDESLFKRHCADEQCAIFPAGTRQLVEQLLRHLQNQPVNGCRCMFLVDCDGVGKTANLLREEALVVTQACDLEADLVSLGVAGRVARRFSANEGKAAEALSKASDLGMSLSVVRRAAHGASISMKRNGRQLRLRDLSAQALSTIETRAPSPADALDVVADELAWSEQEKEGVATRLAGIPMEFDRVCLGKDVLDALHILLCRDGVGEVRGWSCDHFHKVVREELQLSDFANWEVGRRLYAWQEKEGCVLVPSGL